MLASRTFDAGAFADLWIVSKRPRRQASGLQTDRGAVLILVAVMLFAILAIGAVAVDISALQRRGQTLQNTADAAALAGVATWVETGDQDDTRTTVLETISQNGIESDVDISVEFASDSTLEIVLTDPSQDQLLGGIIGLGGAMERAATAELRTCDSGCATVHAIPAPIVAVEAQGVGDGYRPVPVNNRLYAVNHHGKTMSCVERDTGANCWSAGSKDLFWSSSYLTQNHTHGHLHDERIYYAGHSDLDSGLSPTSGKLRVTCFDTRIDQPCSTHADIWNEGAAVVTGLDDRVYVFTNARRAHCYVVPALTTCSTYGGGKDTALSSLSSYSWQTARVRTWNSRHVIDDGRIYMVHTRVSQYEGSRSNRALELRLHCWDTGTDAPCSGFGAVTIHGTNIPDAYDWPGGNLFFYRNTDGDPVAICSSASSNAECYDYSTGDYEPTYSSSISSTFAGVDLPANGQYSGSHTYHEQSNRLFIVPYYTKSRTYCHDFTTGSSCGQTFNSPGMLGPAETYVYHPEPNCLIGLGHKSIFFTLKPDMSGSCTGSSRVEKIRPCSCSGELTWPTISPRNSDDLAEFKVRILDPDGEQILPSNGDDYHDLLAAPLDLSDVGALEFVTLEAAVEPDQSGADPWAIDAPSIAIGIRTELRLVE